VRNFSESSNDVRLKECSLKEWWLHSGHDAHQGHFKRAIRDGASLASQADLKFGVQNPTDDCQVGSRQTLRRLSQEDLTQSSVVSKPQSQSTPDSAKSPNYHNTNSDTVSNGITSSSFTSTSRKSSVRGIKRSTSNITLISDSKVPPATPDYVVESSEYSRAYGERLQKALLSTGVKSTFSRAANLIREATALEGCVFFDASIGSFGAATTRSNLNNETAPGGFLVDINASPESTTSSSEETRMGAPNSGRSTPSKPEDYAGVLGFSTRSRSSLNDHASSEQVHPCLESTLRRLVKRYPHGKIFNFDEEGTMSSTDSDIATSHKMDAVSSLTSLSPENNAHKRKRRISKHADATAILSVLPGARSVVWFPLWDGKLSCLDDLY
jgi:hypothetical protein